MMTIVLVLLALVGMPLFAVIALGAMAGFYSAELDPALVAMEFQRIGELPALIALPLFTFAGVLVARSQTTACLASFSRANFGWLPAGLILYAVVAQQVAPGRGVAAGDLFLAGVLPGLLMLGLWAAYALWVRRGQPPEPTDQSPVSKRLRAMAWELPLPFLVLGGIHGGWLQVTEAAVVTATWVLVTVVLVRRQVAWQELVEVITEAMMLAGAILIILGLSMASSSIMIDAGVPQRLFEWMSPHIDSRTIFVLLLSALLLIAGRLLGVFAALVILVPLIIPVAMGFGVELVHLGIICLANLMLGHCTAPAGINAFFDSHHAGEDNRRACLATLPFWGMLLLAVLIIAAWPGLSLWLPGRLDG